MASKLISQGHVLLNNQPTKASQKTQTHQSYQVILPQKEPTELKPLNLPLDIVFQDPHLVVVNKPAGLVVHPAAGHAQDTLVNALLYCGVNFCAFPRNDESYARAGIVHRLDKDTSGLLVVAKTPQAHSELCKQFKNKSCKRLYGAVVYGSWPHCQGRIISNLARHPVERKKYHELPTTHAQGKKAITHYRLISQAREGISFLKCQLETGRTHQIRVHLKGQGCGVLGDPIYTQSPVKELKKYPELLIKIKNLNRVALHAYSLSFEHPVTKDPMHFQCPWPKELEFLKQYLKIELPAGTL